MKKADKDADGWVEYDEFCAIILEHREDLTATHLTGLEKVSERGFFCDWCSYITSHCLGLSDDIYAKMIKFDCIQNPPSLCLINNNNNDDDYNDGANYNDNNNI